MYLAGITLLSSIFPEVHLNIGSDWTSHCATSTWTALSHNKNLLTKPGNPKSSQELQLEVERKHFLVFNMKTVRMWAWIIRGYLPQYMKIVCIWNGKERSQHAKRSKPQQKWEQKEDTHHCGAEMLTSLWITSLRLFFQVIIYFCIFPNQMSQLISILVDFCWIVVIFKKEI